MERFLATALRPLIRLCLTRGVKVQQLLEITKQEFIEAAYEELSRTETKPSISRVSAMTGLQRKDIKRVQSQGQNHTSPADLLARIIGQWSGDPRFCDADGKARPLTFAGDNSEFAELVRSVSTDLNPYTARFELERVKAVLSEDNGLRLIESALEISGDQEQGLLMLGQDIEALTTAVNENIFARQAVPNLHARTQYTNIAPSALPQIRRWLLERGAALHTELRAYLSRFDRDLNPTIDTSTNRVTVTVATFSVTQEHQPPLQKGPSCQKT